jgi:hypothetical protein
VIGYFDSNVWRNLASLSMLDEAGGVGEFLRSEMEGGRIITPKDVYEEIKHRPVEKAWLDGVPASICDLDEQGLLCLAEIVNNFPDFVDAGKPSGKDPDRPLVAMALARQRAGDATLMVVTQERGRKQGEHRWHIPDACAALKLPCGDFLRWLELSGHRISVERVID